MDSNLVRERQFWIFGSFAVYAKNRLVARQVYETIRHTDHRLERYGTVNLDTGDQVDWVNLGMRPESRQDKASS